MSARPPNPPGVTPARSWTFAQLWPFMRPDARWFVLALGLTPLIATITVAQPMLLKRTIDLHISGGSPEGLQADAGLYLAAIFAGFAVEAVYTVISALAAENTILRLRARLFRQVLSLSQRFFERQPTGQLMSRATSDVDALNEALAAGSISLVLDVLTMLGVLGAMFWLDWRLAALLCLLGPPIAGVIEFARRQMRTLFAVIRDSLASLNAYVAERIAGIEVIQLYGLQGRVGERFGELNRRYRDANVTNNLYDAGLYAFIDGIASVCIAVMIYWGAEHAQTAVSIGLVVAFLDYIDRLFRPLREISGKITFLQRAATALDKIFWLLGVEERITAGDSAIPDARGHLSIRNLRFRYRPDAPWILDGVNLEVKPGEVVAVVGRTGAGKSTLVRLLARVHDGYEGSIEVDGVELNRIRPEDIRRAVGSVRQEVQLFRDTLRFNVTLDDPTLVPERVEAAIRQSGADRLAARHPEGLGHVIRDRGSDLSAGEGQILSLARTLARDPALVILDEATANVDPVSERLLQEAIERLFADRTCLVIAHRLSTVTRADRIVVLDAGRVAEAGSHAELLALDGAYAALYREGLAANDQGATASPR
ncbi:xenobiotic ABC transporter ATP-binding protein [Deltaproteobacteria bacterium]|nr:xenobiotic ABC transporter ATP-binding protein [Deltaproteobacteria bacterium]